MYMFKEGKFFCKTLEEEVDSAIDRWHKGCNDYWTGEEPGEKPSLGDYLGMTPIEYYFFVCNPIQFFSAIRNVYGPKRKT